MTVVGVTGHRHLEHETATGVAIASLLADVPPPLVGVSALAEGADQIFARAVLAAGGELEVIVPGSGFRESLPAAVRHGFDELVSSASRVTTLESDRMGSAAYLAAGLAMLDRCDLLVAVWDGGASRGTGGTADMVRRARELGIPVQVIDATRAPNAV